MAPLSDFSVDEYLLTNIGHFTAQINPNPDKPEKTIFKKQITNKLQFSKIQIPNEQFNSEKF